MFFKANQAIILLTSASIIWGATAPIMKLTLEQIPVFSLAFIRMAVASAILGIFVIGQLKIRKSDQLTFIAAAITGVTLNLTFFFIGLKLTSAILASFLVASVPIFTMLAAHIYLKEKFTTRLIFASAVALLGVTIIIGKPDGAFNLIQTIGNVLLLLSTFAWVAHEIIAKKLLKVYDAATVTFFTTAIGALTFLPLFIWEYLKNPLWINHVNSTGLLGLLYGIIFASLIAYWAWQKGLSLLPAGEASFFFYLDPISGGILSIILLKERLTPTLIIGAILIAAGVFLAEHNRKSHPLHKSVIAQN